MKNIVKVAEGKWFGMIDKEKTIKALEERIIEANPWKDQPPLRCDISYPLLVDVLELLKSQPQIVRCKDCKYCGSEIRHGIKFAKCELKHNWMPQEDWFCADGERREGDSG